MCDFNVESHYSNGFECTMNRVRYLVFLVDTTAHVWTWIDELDLWNDTADIPVDTMAQVALQLWLEFGILLDGFEFLSPSQQAKRRAMSAAMSAFESA